MAMQSLRGQVAIVTGGSRGIGLAIASALVAEGVHVAVTGRDEDHLAEARRRLESAGSGSTVTIKADVRSHPAVERTVARVIDRFGGLDVLVNNAGIARDQLMLRMKRADWDEVLATNLTAAFTVVQAALKPMIRQRSGRIVSIGSVVGQMGNAGQANYAASKAGLIGFSKAVAREVASRQITVNVVAPGLVATDMTQALTDRAQGDWSAQIPLGRVGTPEDVAAAVCFLASDEASYITGQVLAVNGGMYT